MVAVVDAAETPPVAVLDVTEPREVVAADEAAPSCAGGAFDATRVVVADLATLPPQPASPSAPAARMIVRSRILTSGPPSSGR